MSDQRRRRIKAALQCVSHFQSLAGLVVSVVGVVLWMKYRQWSLFFSSMNMMLLVLFILVTGVLLMFTSFLASWVTRKDSMCLQGWFVYALVVVFCVGSTASALALHHSYYLDSELQPLSGMIQNYTGSSQDPCSRAVDDLQESMECCGVHNYTDWQDTSWFKHTGGHLPLSCCILAPCNDTVFLPFEFYDVGCEDKLHSVFRFFLLNIVVRTFYLSFILQVVLVVVTVQLMRESPSNFHYQAL